MKTAPNKSLQGTFDPPANFAIARSSVASNAPELRRWAAREMPEFWLAWVTNGGNMKTLLILLVLLCMAGCASGLKVIDDSAKGNDVGIPFNAPALVQLTRTRRLEVAPGREHEPYAELCEKPIVDQITQILPLGDRYYLKFDKATFGDGQFSAQFGDTGLLRGVYIESQATAIPTAAIGAVSDVAQAAIGALPGLALAGGVADVAGSVSGVVSDPVGSALRAADIQRLQDSASELKALRPYLFDSLKATRALEREAPAPVTNLFSEGLITPMRTTKGLEPAPVKEKTPSKQLTEVIDKYDLPPSFGPLTI